MHPIGQRRPGRGPLAPSILSLLGALATGACGRAVPVDAPFAGAIAAASPEAAAAGLEILARGGNAVDAAVAVALALGVTEPAGSGLLGQTVFLVARPGEAPLVIEGSTHAPAGLPAGVTAADLTGRRRATVPSTPRVLDFAWRTYGSGRIDWADLVAPAIRNADEGFVLGTFRHASLLRYADRIAADPTAAALLLDADGGVPAAGERVRQPLLAAALRRVAEAGAGDVYTGGIARAIADDMARHGGWITLDDLAAAARPPAVLPALHGRYRGHDVHTLPPPFGGWVVLAALNALEAVPAADLTDDGRRIVVLAEALRFGHESRRARPVGAIPPDAVPAAMADRLAKDAARAFMARAGLAPGETTHFSVVDGEGTVVAVTQSLNAYFGAQVAHPELGLLYNDYLAEFETGDPRHPFALRPGALPLSSMSATIVSRDGAPVLVLGSPGSARIISAVVQVIHDRVDRDLDLAAAVAAPRVHVVPGPPDRLYLEGDAWPAALLDALAARGFTRSDPGTGLAGTGAGEPWHDPYYGGVHALARSADGWAGAADPRRDGRALAARRSGH